MLLPHQVALASSSSILRDCAGQSHAHGAGAPCTGAEASDLAWQSTHWAQILLPQFCAVFPRHFPGQIHINTSLLSQPSFYPLIFFFKNANTSFSPLHISLNVKKKKNDKELLTWDHFHHQRKNILFSYLSTAASGYHLSEQSCPTGQPGSEPTRKWKQLTQQEQHLCQFKLKVLVSN